MKLMMFVMYRMKPAGDDDGDDGDDGDDVEPAGSSVGTGRPSSLSASGRQVMRAHSKTMQAAATFHQGANSCYFSPGCKQLLLFTRVQTGRAG